MPSGGSPGQRAQERKLLLPSSFCFLPSLLQIGSFFPFIPCWGFPLHVLEPTSSGFQCRLETSGSPGTTQDVSTLWDCWDIQPRGLCNCWILGPPICLSTCRPACLSVCPSDYPWVFTWLDFVQVLEIIFFLAHSKCTFQTTSKQSSIFQLSHDWYKQGRWTKENTWCQTLGSGKTVKANDYSNSL